MLGFMAKVTAWAWLGKLSTWVMLFAEMSTVCKALPKRDTQFPHTLPSAVMAKLARSGKVPVKPQPAAFMVAKFLEAANGRNNMWTGASSGVLLTCSEELRLKVLTYCRKLSETRDV